MRRRPKSEGGFYGADRFAEFALGLHYDVAESFAASRTHTSAEKFGYAVIPTLSGIDAYGDDVEAVRQVRERALDHWARPKFWGNALSVEHALQWCVGQLIDNGRCYLRVQYSGELPVLAERIDFLAPETIAKRRRRGNVIYEQYVSRHAFAGAREQWHEFDASEIVELRWPLPFPGGRRSPAKTALRAEREIEMLWARTTYALRAGANPDDTLLPLVRARVGAFEDGLEEVDNAQDRLCDLLFDVPFQNATEFFQLERFCRRQEAAATLRVYLLNSLNEQWLANWSAMNSWGRVTLRFRAQLFTAHDWRELRQDLLAGRANSEDVAAALEAEREEVKRCEGE